MIAHHKESNPMIKHLSLVILALILTIPSCGGKTPTPGQVANTIITCTETACTAQPAGPNCTKLEGDVMSCLTSGGNVAVCLAGIPDLVSVGYADVACIIADLATPSNLSKITASPTAQQKAAEWLKAQRVTVQK
jgi:hypothetical protein